MTPDSIKSIVIGSADYTLGWINGETELTTLISITLTEDRVVMLNTTYYDVYIALYNFYGVVNSEEVKFYINNIRADFGFNTIKSEYVTLTVLDYFNSTLFNRVVRLEGLTEYSIFIRAYTLIVNNLYNEKTITIRITRGTITIERLIESQGWTEFKLFANTTYEIVSYINGTKDEEKDVDLDEEYKIVDFGFYETVVPIEPEPTFGELSEQWYIIIIFVAIGLFGFIFWSLKGKKKKQPQSKEIVRAKGRVKIFSGLDFIPWILFFIIGLVSGIFLVIYLVTEWVLSW